MYYQTLINKVGVGLNSKDDLLAQSQCERVSGKSTTNNHLKKNNHLPFQASAALILNIICWSCMSIFMP